MSALRRYLRRVVLPFSPYYRARLAEHGVEPHRLVSFDDLRRLPFTQKRDICDRVKDFVVTPDPDVLKRRPGTIFRALTAGKTAVKDGFEREFRPILMTSTTGRSADPVPFLFSQHDIDRLSLQGDRVMRICGATREMRMLNMFPFAPHLAFWQAHYAGTAFGVFMASTGGGKTMGTEGNLRLLKKITPEVLIGMPTFIYHLLHEAAADGVRCPGLKKIVLGGEKVPVGMRRKLFSLAQELGAGAIDVLPIYGFTEAKLAWPTCPSPVHQPISGYHLSPDLGIFEIIDPVSGEPVADGEPGEIVFTALDARGSAVLRYRTGDMISGGLVYGRCPHCGRVVPRLMGDISRTSEIKEMHLDKLKGTMVDFNQLEHVLDNCEHVGSWQLEIRKIDDDPMELDEIILHVFHDNGTSEQSLRRIINDRLASMAEIHANRIYFHTAAEMRELQGVGTQLKEQRLVDHRPGAVVATPKHEVTHAV